MKKVLSVFLAIALCVAFAVPAFAEPDETPAEEVITEAPEETTTLSSADEAKKYVEDLINGLVAYAEGVVAAIDEADIQAFFTLLQDYADGAGIDLGSIFDGGFDLGAIQELLEQFLADAGFNVDELKAYLADSSFFQWIFNLYGSYFPEDETTTVEATTEEVTTPEEEDTTAPEIPDTGSSATIAIAAFATLSVAAAAAFVCKKKD